ncbi:MAG TPA: AAA family ATPase [Syntrophorhabdus sp.]|jgi:flagellar biosynthesis protein FlhG|nr:P-loop NTPase [Syntrophorhabdus sp.]OPX95271.1 MAG: Flagellum site-determining protein YlxH [Syntrophorhabdus sp. PtaB.Bin027]OQB77475.1 MAG: Flagellum site-determining protein YlxH [Deltaproteobacteria bacterium ADurb.Bin135]MBP8745571.1 P-loop NTPase [Syntrophorhabdus sp.]HNQ46981.1 AAA family ATPase [Syntrophorhabdus sp.]
MLINQLDETAMRDVRVACATLFSEELAYDDSFIENLSIETVEKAYWQKAKRCYHHLSPLSSRSEAQEALNDVRNSLETLTSFLRTDSQMVDEAPRIGKIIAIGGAKGGIGKSIIVANLSVLLASKGFRVTAVDLDLGGANLHLCLGNKVLLQNNINDFLRKRVDSLQDIAIKSEYGPYLIGGDSAQLGAANIDFGRKLKLLRAVENLNSDFIILDLGGDTSYNIIDFFLKADYGIVVTTRDSASYIGAYHFLKAAMYRRFNRLFGPESRFRMYKNHQLEQLIREMMNPADGGWPKSINDLLEKVRQEQPDHFPFMCEVVENFNSYLVVNKVPNRLLRTFDVNPIITRIQQVTRTWLAKEVTYLGSISFQPEVENSMIDLVPVVAKYPKGKMAEELGSIMSKLFEQEI